VSQEDVEVIRRFGALIQGRDIVPVIRAGVEALGSEPKHDAVLGFGQRTLSGDSCIRTSSGMLRCSERHPHFCTAP
jgi:hypothetical protein